MTSLLAYPSPNTTDYSNPTTSENNHKPRKTSPNSCVSPCPRVIHAFPRLPSTSLQCLPYILVHYCINDMAVKIPFAFSMDLGRLCEISDVKPGRACNCVCPSCHQSVIARHGNSNEWHFSHDSHPAHQPDQECLISFWACCRQFIVDCAVNELLPNFTTPPIWLTQRYNKPSTELTGLEWHPSDVANYDIMTNVGGFTIHIYFSYNNRTNPHQHYDLISNSKSGFIDFSIQSLEQDIDHHSRLKNGILKQAEQLFVSDCQRFKHWIRHPLEGLSEVQEDIENEQRQKENEAKNKIMNKTFEADEFAYDAHIRSLQNEQAEKLSREKLNADIKKAPYFYPLLLKTIENHERGNRNNAISTLMFILNRHRKKAHDKQWPTENDLLALYQKYRSGQKL